MDYVYQPTRDIVSCIVAFKNSAEEKSALMQSFKGSVVDKGAGKFKDMKINTSLQQFSNNLDNYLDCLTSYCTSYGQDEKVAKWVMSSLIEYINMEMLNLVSLMTRSVQNKFKADVNELKKTKPEPTVTDLSPLIESAAKAMMTVVGANGAVRSNWQTILDWASEKLNSKRCRQVTEALDGLAAVMESRYKAASEEANDPERKGKESIDALTSVYVKKIIKPIMAAMQKFSEAKKDPGDISGKVGEDGKDDDLLISGKINGFNTRDGKESRHFYPTDSVVKSWFSYILGLSNEEPKLNDQDFRDQAQVFHDNIMRTYQTMRESWQDEKVNDKGEEPENTGKK